MDALGVDGVVVVEDELEAARQRRHLVYEGARDRPDLWWHGRAQPGEHALTETLLSGGAAHRGHEVGQEAGRVAVVRVQREPGDGAPLVRHLLRPPAEQRGLPEAGGRRDERQPAAGLRAQPLDEPRTRDQLRTGLRRAQLGRNQRIQRFAYLAFRCSILPPRPTTLPFALIRRGGIARSAVAFVRAR